MYFLKIDSFKEEWYLEDFTLLQEAFVNLKYEQEQKEEKAIITIVTTIKVIIRFTCCLVKVIIKLIINCVMVITYLRIAFKVHLSSEGFREAITIKSFFDLVKHYLFPFTMEEFMVNVAFIIATIKVTFN